MRIGVAPSRSHGATVGETIFLPDTSTAALANANTAAALAPRLALPRLNPITAPLAHPPSAPFHASRTPRTSSAAHVALDAREIESFVIDVAGERLFVGCD